MFYSTLLIAATALSGFAGAQNFSYNGPYVVDPGTVDPNLRTAWCRGETASCQQICGGQTDANSCDSTTLEYSCKCSSGPQPNISDYGQTIPSFECQEWYSQCITASGSDLALQNKCLEVACGSKNASAVPQANGGGGGSSPSSSSASATGTGGSASSSSAAQATNTGAAVALNVAKSYGTGILAAGMLAMFGLAL